MMKFEKPEINIAFFDTEISASDLSSGTGTGGQVQPDNYTDAVTLAKRNIQTAQEIIVFKK